MAKTIKITYKEQDFTLEYTRKSIETMERQGFNASKIVESPMTMLPALFAGAFIAHHRALKREYIDQIFNSLPKKEELVNILADMYSEPLTALLDEPPADAGNATWEVNG